MIDKFQIQKLSAMPIEGVAERLGLAVDRHKCLCPFHDDTRPSLTFNTYRNRYRCYVCDAHGGPIDLVKGVRGLGFREACAWLDPSSATVPGAFAPGSSTATVLFASAKGSQNKCPRPLDIEYLSALVSVKNLIPEARRFLFDERHIDPRVVQWCGLTSIASPAPCWRYGNPFYDAPSLLIPYYDIDGRLISVQSRYLGTHETPETAEFAQKGLTPLCNGTLEPGTLEPITLSVPSVDSPVASAELARADVAVDCVNNIPRFKFPRGSDCHIYNLQILRFLQPGEELWITEGCSDCWAMLSSGKKAIAIPSATLLKEKDIEPLRRVIAPPSAGGLGGSLHMYPDQDRPGEKLFLELREKLSPYTRGAGEGLQRHQLPPNCKDFSDYWKNTFLNL